MKEFIESICHHNKSFEDNTHDVTEELRRQLSCEKSNKEKSKYIFNFLIQSFSFQGISDRAAIAYREKHGDIEFSDVHKNLKEYQKSSSKCPKLKDFDSFRNCGYKKISRTCNNSEKLCNSCPVPNHDLRKGALNQMAYSLYFFIRDECKYDLIEYINTIINECLSDNNEDAENIINAKNKLLGEFKKIFGVGNKVASMALSDLLLYDLRKKKWNTVGRSMVAVDRLVHNFLSRTGTLKACRSIHDYGKKCDTICTDIVVKIASEIDASKINPKYPKFYPRFVQHSIFHYCATDGENVCNQNSVGNSEKCAQTECCFYKKCARNNK